MRAMQGTRNGMTLINHPTGSFLSRDSWFIPTSEHQQVVALWVTLCLKGQATPGVSFDLKIA